MARYRMRLRTDRSVSDVFAYLADLRNFADWDPGVASSEQVEGDGPGLGASYDVEASGSELRYTVDVYDAPHRIRARARNRWITSVDTISVAKDGSGSIVTYDADVRLNGVLRVADPIFGLVFDRIGDRARDGLAEKLDGTLVS